MNEQSVWLFAEREIADTGVPAYTKGFYYLCYAVTICVEIGRRKASLCKEIYERIANINDVSVESVEKCIRYSIELAWTESHDQLADWLSPDYVSPQKPSNGKYIALVARRLRLERGLGF